MKTNCLFLSLSVSFIVTLFLFIGCKDNPDPTNPGNKNDPPEQEATQKTWVYDFMTAEDDDVNNTEWYFEQYGSNPRAWDTDLGYYLNMTNIAAPYLYTGNFSVEFEFYLKLLTDEEDDYIYSHAFCLVDPNWESSTRRFFNFSINYTRFSPAYTDASYSFIQGDGSELTQDYSGNVPGETAGANTCKIIKEGNEISVFMNGITVGTATIITQNQPSVGYAPYIHGHNSWEQADSNFYLRKVTVTYMSNEVISHNWNE